MQPWPKAAAGLRSQLHSLQQHLHDPPGLHGQMLCLTNVLHNQHEALKRHVSRLHKRALAAGDEDALLRKVARALRL